MAESRRGGSRAAGEKKRRHAGAKETDKEVTAAERHEGKIGPSGHGNCSQEGGEYGSPEYLRLLAPFFLHPAATGG